jgi:hypothetical protein
LRQDGQDVDLLFSYDDIMGDPPFGEIFLQKGNDFPLKGLRWWPQGKELRFCHACLRTELLLL